MGGLVASVALGFVIGLVLGSLGGGGSVLAVPALVYGVGQTAHAATATSLVVVGVTAFVGMVGHLRAGSVRLGDGLTFGLVGVGGALCGSLLSGVVSNSVLLLTFSTVILVAAWRMHEQGTEASEAGWQQQGHVGRGWRVAIIGSVVGFLTGFFGVGGGFVIVPALVLTLGYEMPVAVGTSLLVITINSVEALMFRLPAGGVDWRVAIPFATAGVLGVLLGDNLARRVPAAVLTRWFVWLLVIVACYTAARSLLGM
ncbi:sulfite exporter TauE/SafE family protein [Mycolicibacter arupensis]|jgi:uncharacterized membrane protein YfcA|uniref:Probable membrane transporter protein n=1 Tax=Mycolicibacter arupensis TaxID=342002 RepID=A0A5C7Y993_9MYCO|nr:sulfite exporter TauE/SafE family protein [Mycolicibacter arupensis]TXI57968.1 MAG: sulfite exporter TauE/SafE family protein [Mycolicibacter arupensis]